MTYPIPTDVVSRLQEEGFKLPPDFDCTTRLNAAISLWQRLTGWNPFLSDGNSYSFNYDPPTEGTILRLRRPFLTVTQVQNVGSTLTLGTDYYLYDDVPMLLLEFAYPLYGCRPQSITVTGTTGYCTSIDPLAWEGVLETAMILCLSDLSQFLTNGVDEEMVGDVRRKWGDKPLYALRSYLSKSRDQAVEAFKNRMVGV